MIVSTKGRYALMVMIDLANHDDGGYVSLADISDRQKLSMKYLENVVSMLNKGGMLRSLRGKNGGYRLIKSPEDYNIGEILRITEGSLAPVDCIKSGEVSCGRAHSCVTLPYQAHRRIERGIMNFSASMYPNGKAVSTGML